MEVGLVVGLTMARQDRWLPRGELGLAGERPGKGVSRARTLAGAHVGPREGPFPQRCPLLLREPEAWAG